MTIEEAISTAIEYETKVRDLYAEAARSVSDEVGRRLLHVLAGEEKEHVDHLRTLLDHLKRTGHLTHRSLKTSVPPQHLISQEIGKLKSRMSSENHDRIAPRELDLLHKALEIEIETGNFYKKMLEELGEEGERLFARFVEIEAGHRALVEAEMDHLSGTGYWFDFREFDHEGG